MHQTTQDDAPRSGPGLRPLVVLNAVLVAVLALVVVGPIAWAQPAGREGAARPRGEYTVVGGNIQTGNTNAVYVIDSVNREMIVLRWQEGRNLLEGIGYRDMDADLITRGRR